MQLSEGETAGSGQLESEMSILHHMDMEEEEEDWKLYSVIVQVYMNTQLRKVVAVIKCSCIPDMNKLQ